VPGATAASAFDWYRRRAATERDTAARIATAMARILLDLGQWAGQESGEPGEFAPAGGLRVLGRSEDGGG
jgi:hypothetical protein